MHSRNLDNVSRRGSIPLEIARPKGPPGTPARARFLTGFTLVELLIVMGVLSVLSILVILILNPAELLAKGRDTRRNSDIDNINRALDVYDSQGGDFSTTSANIVYISLPDSSSTCASYTNLPPLPPGSPTWSYHCATSANLRKTDGNGWIPLNFTQISGLSMPVLPIDPVNTDTNQLYYTYIKGSWNLTAKMESRTLTQSLASTDSGTDPTRYEKGTNYTVWNSASGLVAYWPFDEGAGTNAADLSGNGNTGTLTNGPTWTTGQVGGALSFDGGDDCITPPAIAYGNDVTMSVWFKGGSQTAAAWNYFIFGVNSPNIEFGTFGDSLTFKHNGVTGNPSVGSSSSIVDNNWHQAVGVIRSNVMEIWVDGILKSSLSNYPTGQTHNDVHKIGGDCNTKGWGGLIDDVRIYNRALTATEVKTLYNATR